MQIESLTKIVHTAKLQLEAGDKYDADLTLDLALGEIESEGESAWLIENGDEDSPRWLFSDGGLFGWTADSLKAVRFCRRVDAEQVAAVVGESVDAITEHQWGG